MTNNITLYIIYFYIHFKISLKVLRTCNNENIMKLFDLKKTANNFYMILEYCNEGDLMGLMKLRKNLTEEEVNW